MVEIQHHPNEESSTRSLETHAEEAFGSYLKKSF